MLFEVVANNLRCVAIIGFDDVSEKILSHNRRAAFFLLGNDVKQDATGNVFARFLIDHPEWFFLDDELLDIVQRYVTAFHRIVKPPVRIFLN